MKSKKQIYDIINEVLSLKLYRNIYYINNHRKYIYNKDMIDQLIVEINNIQIEVEKRNLKKQIDIVRFLNDYLKDFVDFDYTYSEIININNTLERKDFKYALRTAYACLVLKHTTCMGYAEALEMLLRVFDIQVSTILSIIPLKEVNLDEYKKDYIFLKEVNGNYAHVKYKNVIINGNVYRGFFHYSILVVINSGHNKIKYILDPDRQGVKEKKGRTTTEIVSSLSNYLYLKKIPEQYKPISKYGLGSGVYYLYKKKKINFVNYSHFGKFLINS